MKILVTGAGGFIGSLLIPKLLDLNHNVHVLERFVTARYVAGKQDEVKTVFGDLRDHSAVRMIIRDIQPEIVIHLAAISPVAYSYDQPVEVLETNFLGTVHLAESCLREAHNFKQFLFAGSSEEYGNQEKLPVNELAELRPNSPYAISKASADKYLQYMRDAYGFPITILRNFNTYGRKDNAQFVVERTIVQMLQGKTLQLGDPKPIRDLVYVDDHVNSFLSCLDNTKAIGNIFNFCTSHGIMIGDLVELIRNLTDFDGEIIWNTVPARPLDIMKMIGDYSKAKQTLGWKPKFTLEEGLKLTIESWKNKLPKD